MQKQEIDRLRKIAELVLADTGEPGYYAEVESTGEEATIRLRLVDGYFSKPPSPAEVKPIAQALRTGLIKRGYHVKGVRPTRVREGTVYYYTVRK